VGHHQDVAAAEVRRCGCGQETGEIVSRVELREIGKRAEA
jgi:hypothetical protein